ncbi:hypothetical protein HH800_15735 [Sphingobium yanoikuyae]|uniref:Uncharacterized protein n=1 Tax=Sphingobium yanoikuyae TaxID=13690 RepID=A0A6M4G8P3_SPHYA|nr:hypothetical protein [Sphingobium yanoikuyae]QJR03501.1 hypothetical protein HH800_15735 [Sphingobium yanoikuyae]
MKLSQYLELVVDPTFADFHRNPTSGRHAFLACVVAFHAIDRVTHPRKPSNLRKQWCKESFEFLIIDMIAHHFKHVQCDVEKQPTSNDAIPLANAVFGNRTDGEETMGLNLHNLYFIIRDGISFIRSKVDSPS